MELRWRQKECPDRFTNASLLACFINLIIRNSDLTCICKVIHSPDWDFYLKTLTLTDKNRLADPYTLLIKDHRSLRWDQQGVLTLWSVLVLTPPNIVMGTLYYQQAPSFGWDIKPRSWLSVVIKNPMALLVKSRGVTPVSWPNSPHWPLSIMAS